MCAFSRKQVHTIQIQDVIRNMKLLAQPVVHVAKVHKKLKKTFLINLYYLPCEVHKPFLHVFYEVKNRGVRNENILFRFDAKLLCFGFVSFRNPSNFVSLCARKSKPNRERLDLFRVTKILDARAALNLPSGHLPSSRDFLKEDDDTDKLL